MTVKLSWTAVLFALLALVSGCSNSPTSASSTPGHTQTDIRTGGGTDAAVGNAVTVEYTGWLWDPTKPDQKGLQFDTSRNSTTAFTFTLGAGQVIKGFDEGTVGMRVGGLRRLVIPPQLGYGDVRTGSIPPNSTLVFDIELISIQ